MFLIIHTWSAASANLVTLKKWSRYTIAEAGNPVQEHGA